MAKKSDVMIKLARTKQVRSVKRMIVEARVFRLTKNIYNYIIDILGFLPQIHIPTGFLPNANIFIQQPL
jgi:hypothetical protein